MAAENPDKYFYSDQYNNPGNWQAHYDGTAQEILDQTNGQITHFIAGLGTTGTFTGTVTRLREVKQNIKAISLQPDGPLHGLEGWKHLETAIVPGIYNDSLADENRFIDTAEAYEMIAKVARQEGLLISPSSAANVVGALKLANELEEGVIVTMLPDNAEKYSEVLNSIFNR
jgi:cysteine synthase B